MRLETSKFSASEIWRSSESRCWWRVKVVSSRQMKLSTGRHDSQAQSWWMIRWAAGSQMNVMFVLTGEV